MPRLLIAARVAAATLLLCALALPAAADGLGKFEAALKKAQENNGMPKDALTYKSAKSLGDNGFVLEDVVLTPPPDKTPGAKAEPIPIKRVTVEDFDFASVDKKVPPNFLKMRAEGIAIGAKPAEGIDLAQLAGIDKVTADFELDYRLDPAQKTLTVNHVELNLNGLARLEFSMILDGVTPENMAKNEAMNDASLRTASLVFEDRSLLSKALPAAAKAQGSEADAWIKMGTVLLDGLRKDQGPATLAAFDAVESYMEDYQHPKGPLRLTVNPPAKTSAASLSSLKNPDDAVKALGLVVSYAGTRTHAAAATPPANAKPAATVADGAGKTACTAGGRLFVMHEDAWWSVTVREPTKSGEKCTARIDGSDDDVIFALSDARPWSIDGPGKAVEQCKSGDKVLALYKDGGWYPAKVTDKPGSAEECQVKYDDDNSEEAVELKKVRRIE